MDVGANRGFSMGENELNNQKQVRIGHIIHVSLNRSL